MQFFQYSGRFMAEESRRTKRLRIKNNSSIFNSGLDDKAFFFVVELEKDAVKICIILREPIDLEAHIEDYLKLLDLDIADHDLKEVTFHECRMFLRLSEHSGYIEDDNEILYKYDLDGLEPRFANGFVFCETVLSGDKDKDCLYSEASGTLLSGPLTEELDRIYAGHSKYRFYGHPVHYMITSDDRPMGTAAYQILLEALITNGRLISKRVCFISIDPDHDLFSHFCDCLYKSCEGGTVVVSISPEEDAETDRASGILEKIETLCETIRRYRGNVLTVLCLPGECKRIKADIDSFSGSTCFVEIAEEGVSAEEARSFLSFLAKNKGVKPDKKLFELTDGSDRFWAKELREDFEVWFNEKLRRSIYPQYKDLSTPVKGAVKQKNIGSAYDELQKMTGLADAKKVIDQALAYFKAQRLFSEKGMKNDRPCMHMVFTGNPGTAKTSVARLFARIMRDNGLLARGQFIEAGRADLVGKYVGWTAPLIKKKFQEAEGGVLFIDEAYSLVDDRDGMYGDEAINTIVQEMENRRDSVVVIFAGYPDKMKGFLSKNPGLRSRIAFSVEFKDYDTGELCEIAEHIAKEKGLRFTDDARKMLEAAFDDARKSEDFGNGRYVRNVIEKARMAQASRLIAIDPELVSRNDVLTIRAEDIDIPRRSEGRAKRPIGFSAAQ